MSTPTKSCAQHMPTTLNHVNQIPVQTWNHLRMNDTTLALPELSVMGAIGSTIDERIDERVAHIEMGGGAELTTWIDGVSRERRLIHIPAHSSQSYTLNIRKPCAADLIVDEHAYLRLVIIFPAESGIPVTEGRAVSATEDRAAPTAESKTVPAAESETVPALALRIRAAENAHVDVFEVMAAGSHATCIDSCGIEAATGAQIDIHSWLLNARTSVVGCACNLKGSKAAVNLTTRYVGSGSQQLDMNYLVRMHGTHTKADLTFSGVLKDAARKRLADTIDLVHGCKGSKGVENEMVLLAGDEVRNQSLPIVLCNEDDVEGAHGATVGSISPEQLAYLAARGLTQEEAESLFVRSIFDDCLHLVPEAAESILVAAASILGDDIAREITEAAALDEPALPGATVHGTALQGTTTPRDTSHGSALPRTTPQGD